MADSANDDPAWTSWRVAKNSGFTADDPSGSVRIIQLDEKNFWVETAFRFTNEAIERDLIAKLMRDEKDDGQDLSETEARRAVDDARTFTPNIENPTDMASIPRFMRWFENPYGAHTLAAIIHDELITDEPNGGTLGSDTLSDRFFREMMRVAGYRGSSDGSCGPPSPYDHGSQQAASGGSRSACGSSSPRPASPPLSVLSARGCSTGANSPTRGCSFSSPHCSRSPRQCCGESNAVQASLLRSPRCGSCPQRSSPSSGTASIDSSNWAPGSSA